MRRPIYRSRMFLCLIILLLTAGCGLLNIQVEPLASSPTPTLELPSPTVPPLKPTPTNSVTPRAVVTETPSPVPTQSNLRPNTPVQILQTRMLDAKNGWAVGQAEGTSVQLVLFSSDGGQTWQDRSPQDAFANLSPSGLKAEAYFASSASAWVTFSNLDQAAGSIPLYVWHTHDAGHTWAKSQPLDLSNLNMEFQIPSDLGFFDDQHGWMLVHLGVGMSHDYIALYTTQDAGATWTRRVDPDTQYPLMSCSKSGLVFTSPNNGWLSGYCPGLMPSLFFFYTIDNGQSWSDLTLPVPTGKPAGYYAQQDIGCGISHLQAVRRNTLEVILACSNFTNNTYLSWLYTTQDGKTWTQHVLPVPNAQISFISPEEGVLLGAQRLDPDTGGLVYSTLDSGATWTQHSATGWTGTPDFVDVETGWVVAAHNQVTAFVHTSNGGTTWEEIKPLSGN